MVDEAVSKLATYALCAGLISQNEYTRAINSTILDVLKLDSYVDPCMEWDDINLAATLEELLNDARARGVLEQDSVVYRDLLDTAIMGRLTPRPSWVVEKFQSLYKESPRAATDWYYQFRQNTNDIQRDRIAKDVKWVSPTEI